MALEKNSVLVLYDAALHILDVRKFDCLADADIVMSVDEAFDNPDQLSQEFSLVIADLAFSEFAQQKSFLEIIDRLHLRNAAIVILHEEDNVSRISPQILEKTDVLIPHPVSNSHLEKVMEECWQHYRQKTALQKDLNAIMGAFKTMDKGRFPFQSLSEAKSLSMLLSIMCPNSNDAAVGLLELMVNGIEHGNLEISFEEKGKLIGEGRWHDEVESRLSSPEYSNRYAMVEFERSKEKIEFLISDEGPGFDVASYIEDKAEKNNSTDFTHFHGRGIKLAKQICFDNLEYLGRGNQVRATIDL